MSLLNFLDITLCCILIVSFQARLTCGTLFCLLAFLTALIYKNLYARSILVLSFFVTVLLLPFLLNVSSICFSLSNPFYDSDFMILFEVL